MGFLDKTLQVFVGSRNERQVRDLKKEVAKINLLEPKIEKLSNEELRQKTSEFKHRLESGESLESIKHEAFAVVREAARRTLGQRHYDVQLMGGLVLHGGSIAEMVTGEGKTLTSTCPVYLNALTGRGVHVITVNDYLARRDAEWMGNVFRLLGMAVGFIQSQMEARERRQMYGCDVTYGTNSEFGFDYLRDNMRQDPREQVQRGLNYAVIDEVDSILIDEARTPLIISGPSQDFSELYARADAVAEKLDGTTDKDLKAKLGKDGNDRDKYMRALQDYDFEVREKEGQTLLTDRGIEKVERLLKIGHLYDAKNQGWPHMIEQALKARHLFKKDKNYVVQDGERGPEIIIVDEFTGRLQHGRRWSDGLHQAVEAKEKIRVREESQTYATVTLQNYFRLYNKISGMTGTAMTEAGEFDSIYKLDVVAIPTNRSLIRHDRNDLVYGTEGDKFQAVVAEIVVNHLSGRPSLVGTTSVLKSERLSALLSRISVRVERDTKGMPMLSIRTPVFHLPAPGQGRRGGVEVAEEIKVEPRVMQFDLLRETKGQFEIKLPDPSVRMLNPKANPNIETWFPVREELSAKLADAGFLGVPHSVLNAKLHASEAEIVAQAGRLGAVTIATNMAGRGTDIILGGNGEFHTRQWLAREKNVTLEAFMPEEHRGMPAYLIPRDVQIQAEKEFEAAVKQAHAENFKAEFDAAHDRVVKLGGLAVIGTERHESRRIDNQLRGRCGRQGDPGSTQFFLSLDDDLMRLFAGDRMRAMLRSLGLKDGEAIQAGMVTRAVEKAQRKVEAHHFDMRKNLKEYDDVLDLQRKTIYRLRQSILEGVDREQGLEIDSAVRKFLNTTLGMAEKVEGEATEKVCAFMKSTYDVTWNVAVVDGNPRVIVRENMILAAKWSKMPTSIRKALRDRVSNVMNRIAVEATTGETIAQWNIDGLLSEVNSVFGKELEVGEVPMTTAEAVEHKLESVGDAWFEAMVKLLCTTPTGELNEDRLVQLGRWFLLQAMDRHWIDHLRNMEQLRYGVHWEAQAQKDPKVVYKREGRAVFEQMLDQIDTEVVRNLFHVRIEEPAAAAEAASAPAPVISAAPSSTASASGKPATSQWKPADDVGKKAVEAAKMVSQRAKQEASPAGGSPESRRALPGPNDPCHCGSGRKYKKCHMAADQQGIADV